MGGREAGQDRQEGGSREARRGGEEAAERVSLGCHARTTPTEPFSLSCRNFITRRRIEIKQLSLPGHTRGQNVGLSTPLAFRCDCCVSGVVDGLGRWINVPWNHSTWGLCSGQVETGNVTPHAARPTGRTLTEKVREACALSLSRLRGQHSDDVGVRVCRAEREAAAPPALAL